MNKKKKNKKVVVSFATSKEVVEALEAVGQVLGEEQGREFSRSNIIEIALLRFFEQYNVYIEAKLKDAQNKENKEEK